MCLGWTLAMSLWAHVFMGRWLRPYCAIPCVMHVFRVTDVDAPHSVGVTKAWTVDVGQRKCYAWGSGGGVNPPSVDVALCLVTKRNMLPAWLRTLNKWHMTWKSPQAGEISKDEQKKLGQGWWATGWGLGGSLPFLNMPNPQEARAFGWWAG